MAPVVAVATCASTSTGIEGKAGRSRRWLFNLLAELGVEPSKEAEAVHHGPDKDRHLYEWWYHAIGEVVGGPEPKEPVGLDEGLSVIVKDGRAVAHEGFENLPLVEVSFFRPLPWALATREPK